MWRFNISSFPAGEIIILITHLIISIIKASSYNSDDELKIYPTRKKRFEKIIPACYLLLVGGCELLYCRLRARDKKNRSHTQKKLGCTPPLFFPSFSPTTPSQRNFFQNRGAQTNNFVPLFAFCPLFCVVQKVWGWAEKGWCAVKTFFSSTTPFFFQHPCFHPRGESSFFSV